MATQETNLFVETATKFVGGQDGKLLCMDLGELVAAERQKRGIRSQGDLAAILRGHGAPKTLKPQNIQQLEAGGVKMPKYAAAIARWLGVDLERLYEMAGLAPPHAWERQDPELDPPLPQIALAEPPPGFVRVRRFRSALGAGNTTQNGEHDSEVAGGVLFDERELRKRGLRPGPLAVVDVRGQSMNPTFWDGESVMVDTSQTSIVDDEVYGIQYVQTDGECHIKRLFKAPDGRIRITSDNGDKGRYPDVLVTPDQIRIIGRYAWQARFNPRLMRA